jgi:hypothetical protein
MQRSGGVFVRRSWRRPAIASRNSRGGGAQQGKFSPHWIRSLEGGLGGVGALPHPRKSTAHLTGQQLGYRLQVALYATYLGVCDLARMPQFVATFARNGVIELTVFRAPPNVTAQTLLRSISLSRGGQTMQRDEQHEKNAVLRAIRRAQPPVPAPAPSSSDAAEQVRGRPPTRAERLERWREQPASSVRPPEPRPRPCGGYMLGSGN